MDREITLADLLQARFSAWRRYEKEERPTRTEPFDPTKHDSSHPDRPDFYGFDDQEFFDAPFINLIEDELKRGANAGT
jgi:hypothetical protein